MPNQERLRSDRNRGKSRERGGQLERESGRVERGQRIGPFRTWKNEASSSSYWIIASSKRFMPSNE